MTISLTGRSPAHSRPTTSGTHRTSPPALRLPALSPPTARRTRPGRPLAFPALSRRSLLVGAGATAAGLALAACGSSGGSKDTVTVVTHDSFTLPEDLIAAFEQDTGLTLSIVASGDGGELVNKLVLTKDAPLGDAVFGVDNSFASRVLTEGVIDGSAEVTLPEGADQYVVDGTPALAPIDFGEVCVNVDTAWFSVSGLTPPASFEDLLKPEYANFFVAINPTTSSTGMSFLLATIGHFGVAGFAEYWKGLVANGTRIDEGWSDAYYTDFTAGGEGGAYPVVVSYSSSPASTLTEDGTVSTTAALHSTATRQVEYAGVLAGAANPEGGRAFVEWMLSTEVQTAIPENMYMYPVNPEAPVPEDIERFGAPSQQPIVVDAAAIATNRESWLATWSEAVGA
ncbi:MAG: thiamine ABC transporter substrate-binding protein [Actinomyces sp.]|uniref:thiamine ABC transporter substrate-binding protein n=1 Tax=Actinomyces sp. TaxID=29317 RepID=UPI0026DC52CD|nr:thiamine ABC transporter substrate-binding protein [Actinomyces sp.]MDO4242877.1 thiamine ABC transporter substrate-binding protein [Actinomyces sp.]